MTELINSSHCCFKVSKMSESINPQDIKGKCKFSHFDLEKRKMLSESIKQKMKLQEISGLLKMNPSSISREIKRNRTFQQNYRKGNRCKKSSECKIKFLCKGKSCKEYCRQCGLGRDCNKLCTSFDLRTCNRLSRFPFVCDGCKSIRSCVIGFYHYIPTEAEKKAKLNLTESRRGINLTADQFSKIDSQLVEGTKLGQSVEHMATYCDFPVTSTVNHNNIITFTISKNLNSNIFRSDIILVFVIFPYFVDCNVNFTIIMSVNEFESSITIYKRSRITFNTVFTYCVSDRFSFTV